MVPGSGMRKWRGEVPEGWSCTMAASPASSLTESGVIVRMGSGSSGMGVSAEEITAGEACTARHEVAADDRSISLSNDTVKFRVF